MERAAQGSSASGRADLQDQRAMVGYWASEDSVPEGETSFTAMPYCEAAWAVRLLGHAGLLELREYMSLHVQFKITPAGYILARDESALKATLPTTASEDEEARAVVTPDALQQVIRTCHGFRESPTSLSRAGAWPSSSTARSGTDTPSTSRSGSSAGTGTRRCGAPSSATERSRRRPKPRGTRCPGTFEVKADPEGCAGLIEEAIDRARRDATRAARSPAETNRLPRYDYHVHAE